MTKVFLFDWGDTLMIDFPDAHGKMCDWETVKAVDGAEEMLKALSEYCAIYIATNAQDSNELEIEQAFKRAGLSAYLSGYFCQSNLGLTKGSPEYYLAIAEHLDTSPEYITMVGNSYHTDIQPALRAGFNCIWFNPSHHPEPLENAVEQIAHLSDL